MSARRRPSLVEQVREGLLEDLMSGELKQGAKLPNENELAERFTVSRATIREAVLGLMDAGYLVRRHGSGTYVTASPRARHALETTVSYTAMIREAKTHQIHNMMQAGQAAGMQTMDTALERLVKMGTISPEAAFERAHDKELLRPLRAE